jgi:D-glycero-alpha-D-manno-heptose-7-phosphate kinase
VTVGLLNAMHAYLGHSISAKQLANEACEIEIETLGKPIGVQDQYIAAYGNLRYMRFSRNGHVSVRSVVLDDGVKLRLNEHLMLFYTGISRQASDVLTEQKANIGERLDVLRAIKRLAVEANDRLQGGDFDGVGELMHESWLLKQQLASKVSNGVIGEMYDAARRAGALGGKITGAGGGGFMLLYCPRSRRDDVRAALRGLRELPFNLERDGSKVIFNYRR